MVLNATSNNISVISWRSVLLVEETGSPWENHRPVASHWQNLSHNVVSSTPRHERGLNSQTTVVVIGTDCTGSCKSNYHTITTTTVPIRKMVCWWYYLQFFYTLSILSDIPSLTHLTIDFSNLTYKILVLTKKKFHKNHKSLML